jgi:hypothetical protein
MIFKYRWIFYNLCVNQDKCHECVVTNLEDKGKIRGCVRKKILNFQNNYEI